jgi:hypothetical protein
MDSEKVRNTRSNLRRWLAGRGMDQPWAVGGEWEGVDPWEQLGCVVKRTNARFEEVPLVSVAGANTVPAAWSPEETAELQRLSEVLLRQREMAVREEELRARYGDGGFEGNYCSFGILERP